MTVQEGPDGLKQAAIRTNYPVTEGITAGTTKQRSTSPFLEAEDGSVVPSREKVGM